MSKLYPARFQRDGKHVAITFRDVPEAITQADGWSAGLLMAQDALATALEFYAERGEPAPTPSTARRNEVMIYPRKAT